MLQNLLDAASLALTKHGQHVMFYAMPRGRSRLVPRPSNAVPDDIAALQLNISRMTLFRKLRDGTISPPVPIEGTRRRWWRPADIDLAREQLEMEKQRRAS